MRVTVRTILIGIDDTDNATSPGTGSLARRLCAEFTTKGLTSLGITRHQFLVDEAIPFTSHNSGACIAVESDNGTAQVDCAFDFIARAAAEGSDPGVAIAFGDAVPEEAFDFGRAAQKEVLQIEHSFGVARACGIKLYGLGGNCQGVIGAIASVGLRAQGNDGRFIDMPGLREMDRRVSLHEFGKIGIEVQHERGTRDPENDDLYNTFNWVRPRLINGKPVLFVEWSEEESVWIPVDRKKSKAPKPSE